MRLLGFGILVWALLVPQVGLSKTGDDIQTDAITIVDWRVVAGDKSEFTSDCIGSMATPLCVVDTMMACAAWSDPGAAYHPDHKWPAICKPLILDPSNEEYFPRTFKYGSVLLPKYHRDEYKTIFFPVSEDTMDNYMRAELSIHGPGMHGRPGDLATTIRLRTCEPPKEYELPYVKGEHTQFRAGYYALTNCKEIFKGFNNTAVILRQNPDGDWRIITVENPHRDNTWTYVKKMFRRLFP
ncbi:MAG: hypothetical protein HOM25_06205 [Rhodospirillaceae bacterium]|jgi:hypothetical protein|nr:hypothetical protein [Rhodospirillaceae bacterium]MBT5664817.1 hypothetical protein [Rhodospirillaceae bacterium]